MILSLNDIAARLGASDTELLYDGEHTRVHRLRIKGRRNAIILKQPLGPASVDRVQQELTILERLAGVPGTPVRVVEGEELRDALMLEDVPGASLAELLRLGGVQPQQAFRIAIAAARVLVNVHQRGVIHRDINPANILVLDVDAVQLIDFDLATYFSDEISSFSSVTQLTGTLPFMAPEQTGRTGRVLDKRGDFYSLGATLYALVTGAPPFGEGDPLQIVHDHLATAPTPPVQRNASVPKGLSRIIMRLLEKEPDDRYQSAEGLAFDLAKAQELWLAGRDEEFSLGERDFPARLIAPSRLVGRESERATLKERFDEVARGACTTILVGGAPGVGKSRLLDEVRAWLTPVNGLFAAGKFEQYQQDGGQDGVLQAVRGVLRLLLADPESSVLALRERLREDLGVNAALVAAALPELATLLDVPAEATGATVLTSARMQQVVQTLLRCVASPSRPLVLIVDDLQWASRGAFEILDAIVLDRDLRSVLVLASFRDDEIDEAHPLRAFVSRWQRLGAAPCEMNLQNLPAAPLNRLLEDVLKLTPQRAEELGALVNEVTGGNPFDTLEVLNALRRDGALQLRTDGWHWDAGAVRGFLNGRDVGTLVAQRIAKLADDAVHLLDVMSCLAGEVPTGLLSAASGVDARTVRQRLSEALEHGLLILDRNGDSFRFRHDRVHQAIHGRLQPDSRRQLLLAVARRLSITTQYEAAAAEPYARVVEQLTDPAEIRRAVELFSAAAADGRTRANHVQTEYFAKAALSLLNRPANGVQQVADMDMLLRMERDLHAALYSQGRLAEADDAFARALAAAPDAVFMADSIALQLTSLIHRHRASDAAALGSELIERLGLAVPKSPQQLQEEIGAGMAALVEWIQRTDLRHDLERPVYDSPRLLGIARIIDPLILASYFTNNGMLAWLVATAGRMWREHGPAAALAGPLSHAAFITIAGNDYRSGNQIVRRVVEVADARGYEIDGAVARSTYALSSAHWFRPLEEGTAEVRRAQDTMLRAGELHIRSLGYYSLLPNMLDCAATVDQIEAEAEAAVSLCRSIGNEQSLAAFVAYRQFARSLRGDTAALASYADRSFDEESYLRELGTNPVATANYHVTRALASILSGDVDRFLHHIDSAQPVMMVIHATYLMATARVLSMLALAHRIRQASPHRETLLAELDRGREWLAERAADSPENFLHLLHFIDAERAWARDDFRAAMQAYDAAHGAALQVWRPWHRGLILEQTARFHEAYGLGSMAPLLRQRAHDAYRLWGAKAKAATLAGDAAPSVEPAKYSSLGRGGGVLETIHSSSLRQEEFDLVAILRATQQLSGETDLDQLRQNVGTVLKALTGATSIRLAIWSEDAQDWLVARDAGATPAADMPLQQAFEAGLLPASAFRYTQRTREPLVVDDALSDTRFLRDDYFKGMVRCSLLVVPILTRGTMKAMLVLENRIAQAAFSPRRLDGVLLIASQLATSMDSAMLGASVERRVAQRVRSLGEDNERLLKLSHTDALTGVANRRLLDDSLSEVVQRAARAGESVAVIMLDIDHFKQFNDRYGHQAGDQCLAKVAAAIRSAARSSDLVARYGGEEFVILLPKTELDVALVAAERIRNQVAAVAHPHEGSPYEIVTISVGVAAFVPENEEAAALLVERADHALYHSKRRGRNCVSVDPSFATDVSAANF